MSRTLFELFVPFLPPAVPVLPLHGLPPAEHPAAPREQSGQRRHLERRWRRQQPEAGLLPRPHAAPVEGLQFSWVSLTLLKHLHTYYIVAQPD